MRIYRALDDQGPWYKEMETSLGTIYYQASWISTYRYRLDRDSMHRDDFAMLKYSMDKLNEERQ